MGTKKKKKTSFELKKKKFQEKSKYSLRPFLNVYNGKRVFLRTLKNVLSYNIFKFFLHQIKVLNEHFNLV